MVNGKNTTSIEFKDTGEVVACEVEKEPRRRFEGEFPSKVGVNLGVTKTIGNYEFIKVDCTFDDYCYPEDRAEMFDSLLSEACERIASVVENVDKYKRIFARGSVVARRVEAGDLPASKTTKWILVEEMKLSFKEDYPTFENALKQYGKLSENEAREAIWQLRLGENQFFGELIQKNMEKNHGIDDDLEITNV